MTNIMVFSTSLHALETVMCPELDQQVNHE